ncbi:pentatricopeptide repeat-containing protein At2g03880, mitochondrial [Selaginella moellendorffii]|uniref:pentatricopeptide repeat-containing protein At2g03880, mitochondrial n=1 Tax=Selaginella moellendorffii TaxID=88036 RepID=UPI000D1C5C0D|nr:pentatricopeptide repeat-containing protein At2g03880, mitochondrial [Selaginella moellendorffii]|eukprot:XP_024545067.1 pentatricopeptide repeat-containing protein At2g03880, mitochondrial [Selaginella moellendorffii]
MLLKSGAVLQRFVMWPWIPLERAMSTCIDPSNNAWRTGEFRGSLIERIQQQQQLEDVLDHLERAELFPEITLYAQLLKTAIALSSLSTGIRIHEQISRSGFQRNGLLGNLLLQMYVKNSLIDTAGKLSIDKSEWGVLLWTNAIAAYARRGYMQEALRLFQEMLLEASARPDGVVFVTVLGACRSLDYGKTIHACICEHDLELSNVVVNTALMNMYARCDSVEDARRVFNQAKHDRNVIMYTTMIAAYAEIEQCKPEAVRFFREMQQEGVLPDKICFVATLNACGGALADLRLGKLIHSCVLEAGLESNTVVATALVNMYGKAGCLDEATRVFRGLGRKDLVSWTALMSAYSREDLYREALQLFREMTLHGVKLNEVGYISVLDAFGCPDALAAGRSVHECILETGYAFSVNVANAAIRMFGRCSSVQDSWNVFEKMAVKDVISWTNISTTLVQHDRCSSVIQLYRLMQLDGTKPDRSYFAFLLQACATLSAAAEGRLAHRRIQECGYDSSDGVLGLGIINMYGKCGNLRAAHEVFDGMSERDTVAWTTIISGYAHHGHSEESLLMFWRMQQDGSKPDGVSLLCVLSVCSHAGLVEQGWDFFLDITKEFGVEPGEKHYGCMIDLLGRSGDLEAAEVMIRRMPFQATAMNWAIFLAACKVHSDTERGKRAAEKVLELEPVPAAYVSLSNIYAAAGEWDQVDRVRSAMKAMGLQKDPGRSSIEVNSRVHEFWAGDKSHPRAAEIYGLLESLTRQMEGSGYVPDTKLVLLNVSEEQKERLLCFHSEKLAIAFGLLSTPAGSSLRIIKNLRVCGDCHTAAKFVSRIAGREIFMRDSQRFHHFQDGHCSCGDYW